MTARLPGTAKWITFSLAECAAAYLVTSPDAPGKYAEPAQFTK